MGTIGNEDIIEAIKKQYQTLLDEDKRADEDKIIRLARIKALRDALDGLSVMPSSVNKEDNVSKVDTEKFEYPKAKGWEERIKAYMKFKNQAVKISEMMEIFKPYHPDYTITQLKAALNNAVQTMLKKHVLRIYEPEIKQKGYYYANPMWFEGNDLKEEHIPNLNKNLAW